ncbi:MAG: CoA-binding protein [Cycloclasticus sp.]|nr:CoA-binding protein [Cycloclasticus sp.]
MSSLKSLFEAESVAIVGASDDPHKLGGRPVAYMKRLGYPGKLIPINPKSDVVQGLAAKRSLAELDAPVDLAVIATPEFLVEGIIKEGLACGIKNFVVFASGYAEINAEGQARQQRLEALFVDTDARLLGPNCLGFINTETQLVASFTTAMEQHPLKVGGLSFAGHSGALGAYWLDKTIRADIGVSKWISSGNEVNIQLADIVEYLADDPQTSVICLYIEEIRQAERFESALLRAQQQGKPVIALKGGKTPAGARATQAHTGSNPLNGADYQAIFERTGVIEVDSLSEMIRYSEFYLSGNKLSGKRIGVVSISGGAGVMLSDQLENAGLCISAFSDDLCTKMHPLLSVFSANQNPIDVTAALVAEPKMLQNITTALIQSNEFDAIVIFMGLMDSIADQLAEGVIQLEKKPDCPVFLIWMGGQKQLLSTISKSGVMVFEEIPEMVSLLSKLAD